MIYLLQHSYEIGDFQETKIIGIYKTRKSAEIVIEQYKNLSGFKDYPIEYFFIDEYELNINYWQEGFSK